jgi:leukotriene A-4 hydrolase/aminopeptidase
MKLYFVALCRGAMLYNTRLPAAIDSDSIICIRTLIGGRMNTGSHMFNLGIVISLLAACAAAFSAERSRDIHSFANLDQARVRHIDLDWDVLFDRKILRGAATLTIERIDPQARTLTLDTRKLKITKVEMSSDGKIFSETTFRLGDADAILGSPLTIDIGERSARVRIEYETSPDASGLQWLDPAQTAGKKHPFVFTQSQAIHARSWIPLQDSPSARITYTARVRTPRNLLAVMSAENDPRVQRNGNYFFRMRQAIPSYLIALAAGDLVFSPLGPRAGVYAERPVIKKAAREFADTEKMIAATEKLYGRYRWGRYDLLVLPPSFPFGGMENPRLTFATPTIIAGDKSLVSLVAHELAHSWSGNLVTNATWSDFWLNEGFTTYLERRIIEALYGREREEMEAALGRQDLLREIDAFDERDEILHIDLANRDPDDGATRVPYEKGALFLRHIEETFGRARFDSFLKSYFARFAFQSITTADFIDYLKKNLLDKNPALASKVPVEEWIFKPGLPAVAPVPRSDVFARIERQADSWIKGEVTAAKLNTRRWTTQEWLHFLRYLPATLERARMEELDRAFRLTQSGNAEIAHQWLLMAIGNRYEAAYERLEEYLIAIGRRKLIRPLYEALVKTPEGRARAVAIYRKARAGYHPIAVDVIDKIVK